MGVIAETTNRVAVMKNGNLIEIGANKDIITNPKEIYTKSLVSSVPPTNKKISRFIKIKYIILLSFILNYYAFSDVVLDNFNWSSGISVNQKTSFLESDLFFWRAAIVLSFKTESFEYDSQSEYSIDSEIKTT